MKTRFLLIITVLTALGSYAQTESKNFTLRQCIDYAMTNSASLKNATIEEYIANAKVGEIRSLGLPQINATGQVLDNPLLQRQFLAGNNPLLAAYGYPSSNDVVAIPNLFQLRSSASGYITVNQLIFDGSYFVGLQAAKIYKALSQKATEQTKIQTTESVTKAYYLVLITNERMTLLDKNISRLDSNLKQTTALQKSGFVEKIDLNRLEVTYNNLISEKEKALNLAKMSLLMLKFQMGMPVNEEIAVNGSINEIQLSEVPNKAESNYANRIEYSLLETQKEAQKLDLKSTRAGYAPRLVAFGNIGYTTSNYDVTKLTKNYYQYSNLGLQLSIPIFDGFGKSYKSQQSKLKIQQIDNNMQSLKNTIDMQVASSEISFQNANKSLEIQKKNMALAEEVQRVSQIKYQQGVGSSLEVINAQTSYKEAQTNYYAALYDAMVAKIDYDKAMGNLK